MDDRSLFEAWRRGDEDAGRELRERHAERLRVFFWDKLAAEPGELEEKTFARCLEHASRLEEASTFRVHLYRCAVDVLRHAVAARRPWPVHFDEFTIADLRPHPPSEAAANGDSFVDARRRLPFAVALLLELYYWGKVPAAQMAEILQLPEGTVRARIRQAKMRLRDAVEEPTQPTDDDRSPA